MSDFPTGDTALTHILVVSDIARSRDWYTVSSARSSTASTAAPPSCSSSAAHGCSS